MVFGIEKSGSKILKNLAKVVPRGDRRESEPAEPRPRRSPPYLSAGLPYQPAYGSGTMSGSLGERITFFITFGHDF